MYLYVFVFIIVAILSIHMQLFSTRVARMAEGQTGAATYMHVFHEGAVKYAFSERGNIVLPGSGYCLLHTGGALGCKDSGGGDINLTLVAADQYFPDDFDEDTIGNNLEVVYYENSGQPFILTYLPNVSTATIVGYNAKQVYVQLQNTDFSPMSYGVVLENACGAAGTRRLQTQSVAVTTAQLVTPCYMVPKDLPTYEVPEEAVGIISYF